MPTHDRTLRVPRDERIMTWKLAFVGLAIFLASCGPQAVYLVSPPTTTTTTAAPPTTTTTIPWAVNPTVACPTGGAWDGIDCSTETQGGLAVLGSPHVPATFTCPDGYSLESQPWVIGD